MDLSLFNNSANKVAASDAKPALPNRADANSEAQPKSEKFSSMLNAPQEQAPTPRGYTDSASLSDHESPSTQDPQAQQAAMDQTLFDIWSANNSNDSNNSGPMQQPSTSLSDALQAGMDPTLLQAQAIVQKATGGVPVKIQAILDFIFKSDGLSEKAPILASLKAQAKTPLLDLRAMADNPFFKQLENSQNPDEILKRAIPVGELLSQLQVSPKMLLALDSAGFDLRAKVTPEQLLKAVGITPDRLVSALNMDAPATPTGLHELTLSKDGSKEHVANKTPATTATQSSTQATASATQPTHPQGPIQTTQVEAPAQPTTPKTPMPHAMAKTVAEDPYQQVGARQSENKTTLSFADVESTPAPKSIASLELGEPAPLQTVAPLTQAIDTATDTPIPTKVAAGSFKEETLDALLRNQFSMETRSPVVTDEPAISNQVALELEAQPLVVAGSEIKPPAQQAKAPTPLNLDQIMGAQKMPISSIEGTWENKQDLSTSDSEEFEPIETEESLDSKSTGPEFSLHEATQQHASSRTEHKADVPVKEPVNETHFAEKAKEIFDKAEMLVKDGGGSMKIDMNSDELGKLDLAVNVQGDKVDLRIIASSEKVKEILTQDIPKLREALSDQNLHLKNVEISQQSMGGWNFNSRSQERSFEQNIKQGSMPGTGRIDSMRAFAARPRTYANPVHHSGQIQVLV